jgi:hypothetical protein
MYKPIRLRLTSDKLYAFWIVCKRHVFTQDSDYDLPSRAANQTLRLYSADVVYTGEANIEVGVPSHIYRDEMSGISANKLR